MNREIIVNSSRAETRVAVVEDGQMVELLVDNHHQKSTAGNIYKGKITKILPGMQAAFIEMGLFKDAILHVRDFFEDVEGYEELMHLEENMVPAVSASEEAHFHEEESPPWPSTPPPRGGYPGPIEELLQEGQELMVQVARDPLGTKGARVKSHITLPGRYLVYMPNVRQVGISRKISDHSERDRLRSVIKNIIAPGEGLIVRTVGQGKTEEHFSQDLGFLRKIWQRIREKSEHTKAPALLYRDLDLIFRVVRDIFTHEVTRFVVDTYEEYERCIEYVSSLQPDLVNRIYLYENDEPIFAEFGIEKEVEKALRKKVWLKSGGYIVIEETEALVSVDVNTGKFVGKRDFEDTVFKTNLEAVKEIVRQVRLRDLGGIIIIDFIDMAIERNKARVFRELEEALMADRSPTNVLQLSELGLVEMTRKRVKQNLSNIIGQTCAHCQGNGWMKSSTAMALEILREAEWRFRRGKKGRLLVRAHPEVIRVIQEEEEEILKELKERFSCELQLIAEDHLPQEKYILLDK